MKIRLIPIITVLAATGLSAFSFGGAPKPLTVVLRESFGNNHEVVQHTAFIDRVMAGDLTKPQLEDHYKQRALVHQALDQILTHDYAGQFVPYGDDQKQVITLLRHDIEETGASWPSEDEAWPLTKKFLKELADNDRASPYFALGVFHVYYGGITHGGRDIGALIANELKVDPTYYMKSDGYGNYAKQVDTISDPKAAESMIRGGKEAYKYIIAFNNLPTFRAPKKGS